MRSQIGMVKWIGLGLFFVCSTAVTIYEWAYAIPRRKCEVTQGWWSDKYLKCYTPLSVVNMIRMDASASAAAQADTARAGSPKADPATTK